MSTDSRVINATLQNHKDYLVNDLKRIVGDADLLLREVANVTADELSATRQRFESRVHEARQRVDAAREVFTRKASHAAEASREYVRENPWTVIGVASLAGLLLAALLLTRRA
jgi:ElaB/YqjD/DUF883 family membrane-anchored ribosome-binding protein